MYSNFPLFYSSLFHGRAKIGKRDGWLHFGDTVDFMTLKWGMARSLDQTSPEAGGMGVEQPVFTVTADGHLQGQNQKRKTYARREKSRVSRMQRNQEGKASKRPLVLKLGHQGPLEDYFQSLVEVEWAQGDEKQSTVPSSGVEDLSMPGCRGDRAREEEIMQSVQGCM